MEGAKQCGGVWLPDGEQHLVEWMTGDHRNARTVDGKLTYQHHKLRIALSYVEQYDVAIDIGAHVGLWSMWLAREFGAVHAFEPVPLHREIFALNVPAAQFPRVELYPYALGERSDTVHLAWRADSTGDTHISDGGAIEAQMRRLDEFTIQSCGFMKIDVEGFELPVLEGARATLERCRPVICVEQKGYEERRFGGQRREAVAYLEAMGMRVVREISGDFIMQWQEG